MHPFLANPYGSLGELDLALAETAHRPAAARATSSYHRHRADSWRSRIVSSVDPPLRDRLR